MTEGGPLRLASQTWYIEKHDGSRYVQHNDDVPGYMLGTDLRASKGAAARLLWHLAR